MAADDLSTNGAYVTPGAEFTRDTNYIATRITATAATATRSSRAATGSSSARACPWANRAIIVRRLLGLEDAISLGICGPTHDERLWTFDLDPGGVDPVLGHRAAAGGLPRADPRLRSAASPCRRIVDVPTGQVVTNDFAQMTLDLRPSGRRSTDRAHPTCTPSTCATRSTTVDERGLPRRQQRRLPLRVRRHRRRRTTGPTTGSSPALDWLSERLSDQRYLVGDTITEADVRLFTTLVRFDAVYHGHFKCNRQKLTEMPVLWAYARDLFQTPGFGDTIDFDHIKRHYYVVHTDINPTGIVPGGPTSAAGRAARARGARRSPVRRRHAATSAATGRARTGADGVRVG